jgi:hypothetical protein
MKRRGHSLLLCASRYCFVEGSNPSTSTQHGADMHICRRSDGIEVRGKEEELDLLHQGFRARPGQRIVLTVEAGEADAPSRSQREATELVPELSDSQAFTQYLREEPTVKAALDKFVRSNPMGTPEEFLKVEFHVLPPGFASRGPYAGAYNSLYSRLRTLRVKQGHSSRLTGTSKDAAHGTSPHGRQPTRQRRRDRSREVPPLRFPSQSEVSEALKALVEKGTTVTVREVSRIVSTDSEAENVLLRRRVSAYLSRARPLLAEKLGGTWQTVPARKGNHGGGWKLIVGSGR